VASEENVHDMFDCLMGIFPKLDILVSNGRLGHPEARHGTDPAPLGLDHEHQRGVVDPHPPARQPPAEERRARDRRLLLGAIRAIPNYMAVGASKAALESMVRHLALELGPRGIHVNCVSAGTVETDALRHFPNREDILAESRQRTPSGRLTEPVDVANAVLFLASPSPPRSTDIR